MKLIAFLFLGILLISLLLAPVTELLCIFGDLVKINSALTTSSRAALLMAAEDKYVQDAEVAVDFDNFKQHFRENLCKSLYLKEKTSNSDYLISNNNDKYNDFMVKFSMQAGKDNSGRNIILGCLIEITTNYKFKTGLMKEFVERSNISRTPIKITRSQTLKLDF